MGERNKSEDEQQKQQPGRPRRGIALRSQASPTDPNPHPRSHQSQECPHCEGGQAESPDFYQEQPQPANEQSPQERAGED